jgi:hypothetical protein
MLARLAELVKRGAEDRTGRACDVVRDARKGLSERFAGRWVKGDARFGSRVDVHDSGGRIEEYSLHVRPRMDYPRLLLTVNTLTVKGGSTAVYAPSERTRKGNREAKARVVEKPATVTLYNPETKP